MSLFQSRPEAYPRSSPLLRPIYYLALHWPVNIVFQPSTIVWLGEIKLNLHGCTLDGCRGNEDDMGRIEGGVGRG